MTKNYLLVVFVLFLLVVSVGLVSARDPKISVNQTTSASGCFTGCNGIGNNFDKANIVDGKFPASTHDSGNWIADVSSSGWITIELPAIYTISSFDIHDELGSGAFLDREPRFYISYSTDNSSWTNLTGAEVNLQNGAYNNYSQTAPGDFTAFDAQYFRLERVQGESNEARISEIELFGTASISVNPPTFIAPTPADGTANSTQVTIKAECDPGNTSMIYFNASTPPTTQVTNASGNATYTTTVSIEQTYYYLAGCFDAGQGYSDNSSTRSWTYDTTSPTITLKNTNEFNILNQSNINQYDNNFVLNFTVTDNIDLFALMINVTNSTGDSLYDTFNQSLSGTTWDFDNTIDASTWTAGTYNIQIIAADSHTDNVIEDYEVTKEADNKKSKLTFKTPNDNNIKIEIKEASTFDTKKLTDRYEFEFNFTNEIHQDRTFKVTSEYPLHYRENSGYKGHFVTWDGTSGNWIDFEGTNSEPTVTKISDYEYEVFFPNLQPNVKFRSIGGLNVNEVNYTWYRGTIDDQVVAGAALEPTNINVNFTSDSTISNITTTLVYNNTNYVPTWNSGTGYYYFNNTATAPNASASIEYIWTVNVTQLNGSIYSFAVGGNQSVEFFGIDSCITNNVTTLQFYIYNEDIPSTREIANFEYEINTWISDPDVYQTDTGNLTSQNNYTICIFPSYITLQSDIYVTYTTSNGFTHRYILANHTLDNETENHSLYNFNYTTGISDLKITVRNDDTYNYFSNVIGKLQRRYVGEGVWRTVQMDESGEFGLIFFNIIEENTDYKIIYTDRDNNVLKTTDTSKFVCDSGICELTQLLNPYSSTTATNDIAASFSYDNATSVITATWSSIDGGDETVTFFVSHAKGTGNVVVCNTTQTAAAGTFTCNMTGYSGTAYAVLDLQGNSYTFSEFIDLVQTKFNSFISNLDGAIFTIAIVATIALAAVASPIAAVVATVVGLLAAALFGFMGGISTAFIVVAAILAIMISIKVTK